MDEVTDSAKDFIVEKGYDEKYGARPLKRAIQKHLEDPFAEEIINSSVEEGDLLKADYVDGDEGLIISVQKGGLLEMPDGAKEAHEAEPKKKAPAKKKPTKSVKSKKENPDTEAEENAEAN